MLNLVARKSSSEGTFSTKQLIATIVACGVLRVKYEKNSANFDTDTKPDQNAKSVKDETSIKNTNSARSANSIKHVNTDKNAKLVKDPYRIQDTQAYCLSDRHSSWPSCSQCDRKIPDHIRYWMGRGRGR